MIDLYYAPTPNGRKVSIMLEECDLTYAAIPVNIRAGDQFEPDFVAISPNSKIPAIVDHDGPDGTPFAIFESGAILIYLAEKTGRFLPTDARGRSRAFQWLMFQMASIGPMFGQAHHFLHYAPEPIPYAIRRYTQEAQRLYGVLDHQLSFNEFVAGDSFSIADIAIYPWVAVRKFHEVDLSDFSQVQRWYEALKARPKLRTGYNLLSTESIQPSELTAAEKAALFNIKPDDTPA